MSHKNMMDNRKNKSNNKMKKVGNNSNIDENANNIEIHAQSPIAISTSESIALKPKISLTFKNYWNRKRKAVITNNGSTAKLTFVSNIERPFICNGPLKNEYIFEQLHFHWSDADSTGSEHSINGEKYAVEVHLVHFNYKYGTFDEAATKKDGLAVIGFLLKATQSPNKSFQPLSDAICKIAKRNQSITLSNDCVSWMLGTNLNDYYTYKGSLTTEPYLETVTWIVFGQPIDISVDQVKSFRQLEIENDGEKILCNARPLQRSFSSVPVYHVQQKPDKKIVKSKL